MRLTARERLAEMLKAHGIHVWAEDIKRLHGSRSAKSDIVGGWTVLGQIGRRRIEISSPYTMTACRRGIRLELMPERWSLYGDIAAIPVSEPATRNAAPWTLEPSN